MQTKIVDAIESVLPKRRPIGHHEPLIGISEREAVSDCLKDVTSDTWVEKLQDKLASYCGADYVIATSSGTAALHLALLAVGVKPNDEVLVPALTFVGTANAVVYCGAVPNFVDGLVGLNAYKLRRYLERTTQKNPDGRGRLNSKTGRVISTLIVVDLLGFPADMPKLTEVADEFGLTLVEDAAQALGAKLGNRRCGSFGKASTLSFNNNKIVTGNGGGAVLTSDEWVAAKVWQLATTARVNHPWKIEHDEVGFNYRMKNLNAALAYAQLEKIEDAITKKCFIFSRYKQAVLSLEGVSVLGAEELWQGWPNYWLTTLQVPKNLCEGVLDELHKRGIKARALFTPLHRLPMYKDCPHDNLDLAETTFGRSICLPSGVGLS